MASRGRPVSLVPTLSVAQRVVRLALALVLPLAVAYAAVVWRINAAFDAAAAAVAPVVVERDWAWLDAQGVLRGNRLTLRPVGDAALPLMRARGYALETPGWGWLLATAAGLAGDGWPAHLELALEGVTTAEPASAAPSWWSPWRIALLGCPNVLPAELAEALPRLLEPDLRLAMRFHPATGLVASLAWEAPDALAWQAEWHLHVAEDTAWSAAVRGAPLQRLRLRWEDRGLHAQRNAVCARLLGVEADTFVAREHAPALRAWLASQGLAAGGDTLATYLAFAEGSGLLQAEADGASLSAGELLDASLRRQALARLGVQWRHDGGPLEALVWRDAPVVPYDPASVQPDARASVVEQRAARQAQPVRLGAAIAFERLQDLVGATVEVTTASGTVRVGTLTEYSDVAIYVRVHESTSFVLNLPRPEVLRVRVLRMP